MVILNFDISVVLCVVLIYLPLNLIFSFLISNLQKISAKMYLHFRHVGLKHLSICLSLLNAFFYSNFTSFI